jgi:hypothetical protein
VLHRGSTLAAAVIALLACPEARATCMQLCNVQLVFDDCQVPVSGQWPAELPLGFVVRCGSCCSAPGGPSSCRFPDLPDPAAFAVTPYDSAKGTEGVPVPGRFTQQGTCLDTPRYVFDGQLSAGSYVLLAGDRMMLSVVDTDAKSTARRPAAPFDTQGSARRRRDPPPPTPTPTAPRRGGCAGCAAAGSPVDAGPAVLVLLCLFALRGRAASTRSSRRTRSS